MKKKNRVIIIGCGYRGLSAAIPLVKSGKDVTIIERSSTPGGKLKDIKLEKWIFNPGFDNILNTDFKSPLLSYLTGDRLDLNSQKINPDKIIFKDGSFYEIINDRKKFLSKLKNDFPSDIIGLVDFFNDLDTVIMNLENVYISKNKTKKSIIRKFEKITLEDLLNRYIKSPKLKTILSIHCEKLLLLPEEISFNSFCFLKKYFFKGGYYPNGSYNALTEALIDEFKFFGGKIVFDSEVTEIILEKKKAVGVRLENNSVLQCSAIISTVGIINTYKNLIAEDDCKVKLPLIPKKSNINYIQLYVGFEGDLDKFNIKNISYKLLGNKPFNFDNDPIEEPFRPNLISIMFPSKLRSCDNNLNTCQIRVSADGSLFNTLDSNEIEKRSESIKRRLLDILEEQFNGIGASIKLTKLYIPNSCRSNNFKIDNKNLPNSIIKGLYFPTLKSPGSGIMSSLQDGVSTSTSILKKQIIKI